MDMIAHSDFESRRSQYFDKETYNPYQSEIEQHKIKSSKDDLHIEKKR